MPIEITTTKAILDWTSQKASLSQTGNGQDTLDIAIEKPLLEMETTHPKITIDQRECFAEAGLKNIEMFMQDNVSYSRQIALEGIGRIVDDGNAFINIHENYDPIPDQAIYNAYEMFNKEFNYAEIPSSRPKIEVVKGQINYNLVRGKLNNYTKPQSIRFDYQPGNIQFFMKQYNSINMSYQPSYENKG